VEAFADCSKPPIVKDRRETPSHGYRAIHVIVFPEDIPVEIQIRTAVQDRWAQATEGLGDSWGRGLRYGDGPDEPDSLAGPPFAPPLTRAQVVEKWTQMSDLIADNEQLELDISDVRKLVDSGGRPDAGVVEDLQRRLDEKRRALRALTAELGYGD
jgi:Region found in RelA / SpoT proteins